MWLGPPAALVAAETETLVVPTGVPGFPVLPLLLPPPQEANPAVARANSNKGTSLDRPASRLRRAATPNNTASVGKSVAYTGRSMDPRGQCKAALLAVVLTVSVLLAAAPFGVTLLGLKLHEASDGNPLHANVTCELNPFCGVTVNVALPLCPATMVRLIGLTDTWKSGAGKLIVYVALANALVEKPPAVAMALIVCVAFTAIAVVNLVLAVVGVVPSVVKKMDAPGVLSEMVTDCAELYVPATGENVGVAAGGGPAPAASKTP